MTRARIGWIGPWRGALHNFRYAALFQHLPELRVIRLPHLPWRLTEAINYRLGRPPTADWLARATGRIARHRFDHILVTAVSQLMRLSRFPGRIIYDRDDAVFDPAVIARLNQPDVACVVATSTLIHDEYRARGVTAPIVVIPSGVNDPAATAAEAAAIRRKLRTEDEIVVGFPTPRLFLGRETTHDREMQLRSIDFLWAALEQVWQTRPNITVWLIGHPSPALQAALGDAPRVRLLGFVPHAELPAYISNFDIAVYPRPVDFGGRHSIKLVEFMAGGVPIVATDVSEAYLVRDAGAGLIAADPAAFAAAIVRLAGDPALRRELGARGRAFAADFLWPQIAARYRREVFAAYLPAAGRASP